MLKLRSEEKAAVLSEVVGPSLTLIKAKKKIAEDTFHFKLAL